MAFNLTRMSVYALICALEEDLRALIKNHIKDISLINKSLLDRARLRVEKDIGVLFGDLELNDYVDYFDLGDTYQIINGNSTNFPIHVAKHIKSKTPSFDSLVPIRNRVMHIRPLNYDDYPTVSALSEDLLKQQPDIWLNTKEILNKLATNPSYVLGLEIKNLEVEEGVSHNLPLPDFDETGLIGRDDDVAQVKKLCLGAFPVISIVGEGGVGKTALALKVAYELLEDRCSPFDAIVWVTSKTTQITVNEIREIKGAIKSSLGIIQEIADQISGNPHSSLDEIVEYLSTFKIALFIDNLETILDENIKSFVSALPQGSKIIITSRIGLGAYEYPVKLQGISEGHASQLLRVISRLRRVDSLSRLDESVMRHYVNRMHRNPSYIKWFVSSVQTGIDPENVLQNSGIFLDFCMSNVYEFLSSDAQTLTSSLQCAPGHKDIPELAYLNDFDSLRVQKSIQELMSTNMLSQASKAKGASVKTTYQLSELARSYLGKYHKPSKTFQDKIRDKRNKLNSIFEQQLSKRNRNTYSLNNIKFRDKSDRVIVKMLYDAQRFIVENQHDIAYELLQEAHRLAPDFFEVARVLAYFHQKSGNLSDAREQYELAILLSPGTPQLHYWFGKFLLHQEENVDEAVAHFEMANKLDPESLDVALSLARGYMFKHEFDRAKAIIDSISEAIDEAEDNLKKIFLDTDVQIHYRRADDFCRSGDFSNALVSLESMRDSFDSMDERFKDRYIRQKLKKSDYNVRVLGNKLFGKELDRIASLERWISIESSE